MKNWLSFTYRSYCAWLLGTVLGGCPLTASASDEAGALNGTRQKTAQGQELMKEGAKQFDQGDWQAAYLAYRKAWEIKPHPAIAANMAAAEIKLGMYLDAADHLKYALTHLPLVHIQKRDAVEQQLDRVREHLVAVSLSANLDGVEISIDGKRIGCTPLLEEVLLEPGHHAVRAEYASVTQTRSIDVNAGARLQLVFDLSGTASSADPATRSVISPQPFATDVGPDRTRTWLLIGGAATTAIGLGIGIAMSIQANAESRDAQTLRAQIGSAGPSAGIVAGDTCTRRDQSEACDLLYRNVQSLARDRAIATAAFVGAGVLGVATVATALIWPPQKSNARPLTASPGGLHVAPWAAPRGYGLSASLTF